MGSSNANISRDTFVEQKEYKTPIFQQGPNRPLVDADINEGLKSLFYQLRRSLQLFGTSGSPDNGFKIEESLITNINNFKVIGGDGTADGSGRIIVQGLLGLLFSNVEWNTINPDADYIHERSTGLSASVLTCSSANWNINELVGRLLIPNTPAGNSFTIVANTQTTIQIGAGDMTVVAAIGDTFRVDPSTPSSPPRQDVIYLDMYVDEIDETEDGSIPHPMVGGPSFVSAIRERLKHIVNVREGSLTVPSSPFVDADARIHYYIPLAELYRTSDGTIRNDITGIGTPKIFDRVVRDLFSIPAIKAEIVQARGNKGSLDERLDVSLQENGIIKNNTIIDQMVNPIADIAQSKISESVVYDDSFVGTPSDIEDDLNQVRTIIKTLKGTLTWTTPSSRDMEVLHSALASIETEVQTARGTMGSLDNRLDVSLNENGTLKPIPVSVTLPKLAAEQAMVFYPKNSSPYDTYRLHQMRGMFRKTMGGPEHGPYFDYGPDHPDYPLDVFFTGPGGGAFPGPGKADNTFPGPSPSWYYVYIIGKADGSLSLVYSINAPWSGGPALDDALYQFQTNGWIYWKFVACILNLSLTWELAQIRKIGNHVTYELVQRAFQHGVFGDSGWQDTSIANRVPPTSMRALVTNFVEGENATQTLMLRPPSVAVPSGGVPGLHEIPTWPSGPSREYQLIATCYQIAYAFLYWDNVTGWVDLNNLQEIGYRHISGGVNHVAYIDVLGYEEFTDFEATVPVW